MKALAIDSAVTCISLAARNDLAMACLTLDIGMKQSEKLLPSIDLVLQQVGLVPKDLDFIALSQGPGSFTGLRLGFAAAKALQMAVGCPIYPVPTLEAQAFPFLDWPGKIVSAIDAKKDRFYCQLFSHKQGNAPSDSTPEEIITQIKTLGTGDTPHDAVLLVGPDCEKLKNQLQQIEPGISFITFNPLLTSVTEALFSLAEKKFLQKDAPLAVAEGPIYLRKSEAEENHPTHH